MALMTTAVRQCDFDHEGVEVPAVATLSYVWDGEEKEVDICAGCKPTAEQTLATFADVAHKPVLPLEEGKRPQWRRDRSETIRAWAKKQRKFRNKVSDRGRIPKEVEEAAIAAGVVDPLPIVRKAS